MSFPDLIAHLFLELNSIPLSGCTTVNSFSHLLRDILFDKAGFCVDKIFNYFGQIQGGMIAG